jgi:hypothetical protein
MYFFVELNIYHSYLDSFDTGDNIICRKYWKLPPKKFNSKK